MRVLVVDDNSELAENIAEILLEEGHEAVVASSGPSALDLEGRFDFVLLDVCMDGMDGVELMARLKVRRPQAVYVMMTAFSNDERLDRAREGGALDVLDKPVEVATLLELVNASAP